MGRRGREADAELERLYAQVPDVECKGLCTDACGPVEGGHREMVRMRQAGVRLPPRAQALREMVATNGGYQCPALTDEGRCGVYEVRPMICRVWGASEDLVCPYGCAPRGRPRLSSPETLALVEGARVAGTAEKAPPVTFWEQGYKRASVRRAHRLLMRQPVPTHPIFGRPKVDDEE